MSNLKPSLKTLLRDLKAEVTDGIENMSAPLITPTGVLEPAIEAVGSGEYRVVNLQCANKLGKTTLVVNILKNIFWECDKEYFDYPVFHEWPFVNDDGLPIKRARIICTPQNASDSGPIREEIKKWWPKGRYTAQKGGKNYYMNYETDTGWFLDVMTFEQAGVPDKE